MKRINAMAAPLLSGLLGFVGAFLAHAPWRADLGTPLTYAGDLYPHALAVDQVLNNGWFWHDPRLAAPVGQNFQDWPLPDVLLLIVAKFFGIFTTDWAVVVNVIYLLTYPLVAICACWVMIRLGVNRWTAAVLGVLYTLLPYHVARGESHLFLSGYFMVPFGVLIAMRILNGDTLFSKRVNTDSKWLQWLTVRNAGVVAICLLIAMSGVYYSAFTLVLIGVGTAIALSSRKDWKALAKAATTTFVIMVGVIATTAGTLYYHATKGDNPAVADRLAGEADLYGLKLAQLILPVGEHRIDALSKVRADYLSEFPLPSEGWTTPLGFFGALGVIALLCLIFVAVIKPLRSGLDTKLRHLAVLNLGALLVASIGGVSTFIAMFLVSEIRSWNRMSVFIAFIALTAVGLVLDQAIRLLRHRLGGNAQRTVTPIVLVGVLLVGTLDQTSQAWIPPYDEISDKVAVDRKFFGDVEKLLPENAAVYQLPRMDFPESPPYEEVDSYDHLRGYLNTEDIRWSFAGIRGRFESAWQERLDNQDTPDFLTSLAAVGYQGLYIDRFGYTDKATDLEGRVEEVLGKGPTLVSSNDRFVLYDLRQHNEELRLTSPRLLESRRNEMLFPVIAPATREFYEREDDSGVTFRWAMGPDAPIDLVNSDDQTRQSQVSFSLSPARDQDAIFTIRWPDGTEEDVETNSTPRFVTRSMSLEPGRHQILVRTNAARESADTDARELYFQVRNLVVAPS